MTETQEKLSRLEWRLERSAALSADLVTIMVEGTDEIVDVTDEEEAGRLQDVHNTAVRELEAENQRLRAALEAVRNMSVLRTAHYDRQPEIQQADAILEASR